MNQKEIQITEKLLAAIDSATTPSDANGAILNYHEFLRAVSLRIAIEQQAKPATSA